MDIIQIQLIMEGAVIPKGFELINKSVSGNNSAFLNPIGYLAIKRAPLSDLQYIRSSPYIDSIIIVLGNEDEIPDHYYRVKSVLTTINNKSIPLVIINNIHLAVHIGTPLGICDLSYEYATIDRYPLKDQKNSELPVNELPMFGFPHGLKLHYGNRQRYPLPIFFTFVFTDYKGDHFYAECLRFYEIISSEEIKLIFDMLYDSSFPSNTEKMVRFNCH